MFLLYLIFSITGLIYAKILFKKMFLHVTFRIFLSSLILELFSFLFTMSEYAQFSQSGITTPGMLVVARLLDSVAQTLFLLMLVLLAKGFNVTRGSLRTATLIKIAVLLSAYIFAIVFAFIYSEAVSFN